MEQEYPRARKLHTDSFNIKEAIGDKIGMAISKNQLGDIALQLHELPEAQLLFEESLKMSEEIGDRIGTAISLQNLGYVVHRRGDHQEALSKFVQSLAIMQQARYERGVVGCVEGIAWAMISMGLGDDATRLLGAAQALREKIKQPILSSQRSEYESNISLIQQRMSKDRWTKLWEEGRAMSMQQMLEYALKQGQGLASRA